MVLDTRRKAAEKVSFRRGQQCSPKKISYIDDNNRGMINDKTYPVHISCLLCTFLIQLQESKNVHFFMFQDVYFQSRSQH